MLLEDRLATLTIAHYRTTEGGDAVPEAEMPYDIVKTLTHRYAGAVINIIEVRYQQ